MIGLIMLGAKIVCEAVGGVKDIIENNENKQNSSMYDGTVYIDNRGKTRWSENNREVYIGNDMINDFVIKDLYTGYVYRNITEEKSKAELQKEIENYKKNGNTTVCLGLDKNYKGNIYNIPQGARFRDAETGADYVIREIWDQYYYVDPDTLTIVRRTDRSEFTGKNLGTPVVHMGTTPYTIDEYNKKYGGTEYEKKWNEAIDFFEFHFHGRENSND